jgi:hypothetical protein
MSFSVAPISKFCLSSNNGCALYQLLVNFRIFEPFFTKLNNGSLIFAGKKTTEFFGVISQIADLTDHNLRFEDLSQSGKYHQLE